MFICDMMVLWITFFFGVAMGLMEIRRTMNNRKTVGNRKVIKQKKGASPWGEDSFKFGLMNQNNTATVWLNLTLLPLFVCR